MAQQYTIIIEAMTAMLEKDINDNIFLLSHPASDIGSCRRFNKCNICTSYIICINSYLKLHVFNKLKKMHYDY